MSIEQLSIRATQWCQEHGFAPLSNLVGDRISVRNIRYYQSLGMVDKREGGYGQKHLLQLIAIRILQCRGLPLMRIQVLLYGRTEEDLLEIQRRAIAEQSAGGTLPPIGGSWQVFQVTEGTLIVSRERITPEQHRQISNILKGGYGYE